MKIRQIGGDKNSLAYWEEGNIVVSLPQIIKFSISISLIDCY